MVVRVAVRGVMLVCAVVGLAVPGASSAAPASQRVSDRATAPPPHVTGPHLVELGDDTEIDLPAGMILYERADARRLLRTIGEPSDDVLAIVREPGAAWTVILSYSDGGYVEDADASALDAGELLGQYRDNNRAQNERRRVLGAPALAIDGWTQLPHYDRARHRLSWGLAAHTAGGTLVNLFTRILGRGGFLSVNLIDDADAIARSELHARSIVPALRFKPGARYGDHLAGDPRTGRGLRDLVLGSAGVTAASQLSVFTKVTLAVKNTFVFIFLGALGALGIGELFRRRHRRNLRPAATADLLDNVGPVPAGEVATADRRHTEELTVADLLEIDDEAAAVTCPAAAIGEIDAR
jgi:uncharacterized membrane-anchored protein